MGRLWGRPPESHIKLTRRGGCRQLWLNICLSNINLTIHKHLCLVLGIDSVCALTFDPSFFWQLLVLCSSSPRASKCILVFLLLCSDWLFWSKSTYRNIKVYNRARSHKLDLLCSIADCYVFEYFGTYFVVSIPMCQKCNSSSPFLIMSARTKRVSLITSKVLFQAWKRYF